MQTTAQRRQGRESSGPESLLEVNGRRSMFVCIPHQHVYHTRERERVLLCGYMLWRHRESFRSAYGLLERLSSFFVILLTCRFARVYVYCRLKKPCET